MPKGVEHDKTRFDPAAPLPAVPASPPAEAAHELRSLGNYRILRRLGEGGMGAVYLGYHEGNDLQVAIKVLADSLVSNQAFVDRFYREAKSGALLNHPNIVRGFEAGQDRATGKHYLVLEFVDGPSAHALLDKHGPLSVGDAVHIALDIARALEHAHTRNIVHRDIKPDNILLTRSGVAKLVDLGLAKRIDEASHLTAARQGFGTTHYMPYEQAINAKYADGRSDIYALGATLYHLVTGSVPFPGENHLDVVEKKNQGDFLPAASLNDKVPAALDQILARMLARHPRDRYQTASELIVDLERSRLAAPVPSFADPNRAAQDPWVQACLASSAEPTRLDPESSAIKPRKTPTPGPAAVPSAPAEVWLLRYRKSTGQVCRARATTLQIVQRLKEGRLPAGVEACRRQQEGFRPLAQFVEFRALLANGRAPGKRVKAARPPSAPPPASNGRRTSAAGPPPAVPSPWRQGLVTLLWVGGTAVLVGTALGLLYHFFIAT
jgi:serine/threonine-protein kinase